MDQEDPTVSALQSLSCAITDLWQWFLHHALRMWNTTCTKHTQGKGMESCQVEVSQVYRWLVKC